MKGDGSWQLDSNTMVRSWYDIKVESLLSDEPEIDIDETYAVRIDEFRHRYICAAKHHEVWGPWVEQREPPPPPESCPRCEPAKPPIVQTSN